MRVSDDLHDVGIDDFFVHVIAKDESGLKKQHIHSGNYLETLDFIRDGFIGAAIGFFAGVVGCHAVTTSARSAEHPVVRLLRARAAWRRCSAPGKAA